MRPDLLRVLTFCKTFGFIPFDIVDGRLAFSWHSHQLYFFLVIFAVGLADLAYIVYATVTTYLTLGMLKALHMSPWVSGFGMNTMTQTIMLWKRHEFISYTDKVSDLWEVQKSSGREQVQKRMYLIHATFAIFAGIYPIVSINYFNYTKPGTPVFISAMFCPESYNTTSINGTATTEEEDVEEDPDCPAIVLLSSLALNTVGMFYGYLGYLIVDVLPLGIAIDMAKAFAATRDHVDSTRGSLVRRKLDVNALMRIGPQQAGDTKIISAQDSALAMIASLRLVMEDHLKVQRLLKGFSRTFSLYIIVSVINLFAMCTLLFYFVIKIGFSDMTELVVYFGNGLQMFIRGMIVLNAFGNVAETAEKTRELLELDVSLFEELRKYDSSIVSEVHLFTSRLGDVNIKAKPYFTCTHNFITSFFGLLATYVVVLLQSGW